MRVNHRHRLPTFELETALRQKGYAFIVGCDEAGRGAICGPIVAAAVILDPLNIPPGIDDSKRLSPKRRLSLYHYIHETSHVGIAVADHHRNDRDNVLQASLWAMSEAVGQLSTSLVTSRLTARLASHPAAPMNPSLPATRCPYLSPPPPSSLRFIATI